jgi:hypothetical protein
MRIDGAFTPAGDPGALRSGEEGWPFIVLPLKTECEQLAQLAPPAKNRSMHGKAK